MEVGGVDRKGFIAGFTGDGEEGGVCGGGCPGFGTAGLAWPISLFNTSDTDRSRDRKHNSPDFEADFGGERGEEVKFGEGFHCL